MRRKSFEGAECPVARSLDVIGDWWSLLIVRDALRGKRRFGEFQKSLGVSRNILTLRLRALVAHGILQTIAAGEGGGHQDYLLTQKGRDLFPVLVALREWGAANLFDGSRCSTELVDRDRGRPVRKLELRSEDGRLLDAGDTLLQRRGSY